ncbi:MAG: four helix bundle protein [Acidobacteria bacterium]|nr:four helix bundle protein [Acidobacteriota bacterium]
MLCAMRSSMIAGNLQELRVYQKAVVAADAVSALLKRPAFSKDFNLKDQLSRSSSRVAPLIAEGYGQLTDRHVAVYLGRARGSVLETVEHLRKAYREGYLTATEHTSVTEMYDHIGRMLTCWIHYLRESDWKDRG